MYESKKEALELIEHYQAKYRQNYDTLGLLLIVGSILLPIIELISNSIGFISDENLVPGFFYGMMFSAGVTLKIVYRQISQTLKFIENRIDRYDY